MATRTQSLARRRSGFTLIELMIAVAIVATLAAIALPSYNNQIRKSRRTEARMTLLDLAARTERLYSVTNTYFGTTTAGQLNPVDLGYLATDAWPLTVGSGYYQIRLSNSTATTFTFTATPIGSQAADTQCVTFSVDNTGNQQATDPTCWK
jgi:type IV pilus assembly protein PilE